LGPIPNPQSPIPKYLNFTEVLVNAIIYIYIKITSQIIIKI
jgi:hypothetical protein